MWVHRTWIVLLGVALGPACALAQSVESGAVRAWFEEEHTRGAQLPVLGPVLLRYTVEFLEVPSSEDLHRLREEIRTRPDHPDASLLEAYERRQARRDIYTYDVYLPTSGSWRCSKAFPDGTMYFDVTVTPEHAWGLSPALLAITDRSPNIPRGYDYAHSTGSSLFCDLADLFHGSVGGAHDAGLEVTSVSQSADTWQVDGRTKTGLLIRYSGVWDAAAGRGFVTRVRSGSDSPAPGADAEVAVFEGWRQDPTLGAFIATRVTRGPEGRPPSRLLTFQSVSSRLPENPGTLIAIPSASSVDPIRGALTFRAVQDFRNEMTLSRTQAADGAWSERSAPRPDPAGNRPRMRTLGWILAGSLVTALIALRIRNRGSLSS